MPTCQRHPFFFPGPCSGGTRSRTPTESQESRFARDFLAKVPNRAPYKTPGIRPRTPFPSMHQESHPDSPPSRVRSRRVLLHQLARPTLFQAPSGRDKRTGEFARSPASFPCPRFAVWCPKSPRPRTPASSASQQWRAAVEARRRMVLFLSLSLASNLSRRSMIQRFTDADTLSGGTFV